MSRRAALVALAVLTLSSSAYAGKPLSVPLVWRARPLSPPRVR